MYVCADESSLPLRKLILRVAGLFENGRFRRAGCPKLRSVAEAGTCALHSQRADLSVAALFPALGGEGAEFFECLAGAECDGGERGVGDRDRQAGFGLE
jgi:hypothetical protein